MKHVISDNLPYLAGHRFMNLYSAFLNTVVTHNKNKERMIKNLRLTLSALLLLAAYGLSAQDVANNTDLNQAGALRLAEQVRQEALKLGKNVSVAVLNSSGVTLLLLKGDDVGPHNTEASRRKAYTAVSTKTASWDLMRMAAQSKDAGNLNTLPELLLLGGGVPVWKDGKLVGGVGVSGAGGGENDHEVARKSIEYSGFTTGKP